MKGTSSEDEERKKAYNMAYKRFEPIADSDTEWDELTERQQQRVIRERLSYWKQSVEFRTIVAPVLRSVAKQLADSQDQGIDSDSTTVDQFEAKLFEAFDAGAYDAQLDHERYASLE